MAKKKKAGPPKGEPERMTTADAMTGLAARGVKMSSRTLNRWAERKGAERLGRSFVYTPDLLNEIAKEYDGRRGNPDFADSKKAAAAGREAMAKRWGGKKKAAAK